MRQRIRTRPIATITAILAYSYTVHNGRKALRGALADTPLASDAEQYAAASTYLISLVTGYTLWRWRRNRRLHAYI